MTEHGEVQGQNYSEHEFTADDSFRAFDYLNRIADDSVHRVDPVRLQDALDSLFDIIRRLDARIVQDEALLVRMGRDFSAVINMHVCTELIKDEIIETQTEKIEELETKLNAFIEFSSAGYLPDSPGPWVQEEIELMEFPHDDVNDWEYHPGY